MNLGGKSFLLVDDDHYLRILIASILHGLGNPRITESVDAIDGFDFLAENRVDLVIASLNMNLVNGIEFTRMIRRMPDIAAASVPVLVLADSDRRDCIRAVRDGGADDVIFKPVAARRLLDRIVTLITQSRDFVRTEAYAGPDRRRTINGDYIGPKRRIDERNAVNIRFSA